jgi:hypothetical protein
MSRDVELHCRCGAVRGKVKDASPQTVTRALCYCDDCQAYLHHLGRADLLDAHGGTDVVQVAPASLTFDRGAENIAGMRLGPKGLYRWYASCCKTPLGNTLTPAIPFVGIVVQAFDRPEDIFGKPMGAGMGQFAIGTPPDGATKFPLRLIVRAIRMVLGWRLRGKSWPHPYFDRATRAPNRPVTVLSRAERDALRPLCGPHPTAAQA